MATAGDVSVRRRLEDDLAACVSMAKAVHALDGYPPYLPDSDLAHFLASDQALAAWVAVSAEGVVGHVAVHSRSAVEVMEAASVRLGLPADRLGVVARLLVAPRTRRAGVGRALLETAARGARELGLHPILDVGTGLHKAVALYESAAWIRLAKVEVRFLDGATFEEFVYAAPTCTDR